MRVDVVTLFPEMFAGFLATSFVARAIDGGKLAVRLRSPRDFGLGKHRCVDDTPYGGGSGMVMRVDVLVAAMESLDQDAPGGVRARRALMTPQGRVLDQGKVNELAEREALMLVCGRYEGFDERVRAHVDEEISLGDFGDDRWRGGGDGHRRRACARLLPGVLLATRPRRSTESHSRRGRAACWSTRTIRARRSSAAPASSMVLAGGNHAEIARWRREQSIARTRERRPDLWEAFRAREAEDSGPTREDDE